jgi:hypothetical protein
MIGTLGSVGIAVKEILFICRIEISDKLESRSAKGDDKGLDIAQGVVIL